MVGRPVMSSAQRLPSIIAGAFVLPALMLGIAERSQTRRFSMLSLPGLVMFTGRLIVALTGVPANHVADRFGPGRITNVGLVTAAANSFALSAAPATFGIPSYVGSAHRCHGWLYAVSGRQQYRRHDGCGSRPKWRHIRHAEPVARSRAYHRRICHGGGSRCVRSDRHESAARRRRQHACHIRDRGGSGYRRGRHLGR